MVLLVALLAFFAQNLYGQSPPFTAGAQPAAPDYADEKNWAALPFRTDAADAIPKSETWIDDSLKEADVFYIYPTIYEKGKTWNADVRDEKLNKKVDEKPVHYQASVFNESCRVYAPRYRQAVVKVFYPEKSSDEDSEGALALAYSDVQRAFQYYLDHYNHHRPIIIAAHSQGSYHARKLLQEFFDTTNLRNRLIAAYVVGMSVNESWYQNLKICNNENQTGCFAGWISYKAGYMPDNKFFLGSQCVNPVSWSTDTAWVDKSQNLGTVVLHLNKKHEHVCSAKITGNRGVLWVKTKAPLLRYLKNLHIVDYNLFWYDIRANVKKRIGAFWKT